MCLNVLQYAVWAVKGFVCRRFWLMLIGNIPEITSTYIEATAIFRLKIVLEIESFSPQTLCWSLSCRAHLRSVFTSPTIPSSHHPHRPTIPPSHYHTIPLSHPPIIPTIPAVRLTKIFSKWLWQPDFQSSSLLFLKFWKAKYKHHESVQNQVSLL